MSKPRLLRTSARPAAWTTAWADPAFHAELDLLARDYVCEVEGCDCREHLEIDHIDPWAQSHRASVDVSTRDLLVDDRPIIITRLVDDSGWMITGGVPTFTTEGPWATRSVTSWRAL